MLLGLGAALAAAVLYGVAAVLQATGARRVAVPHRLDPRVMGRILRQPVTMVAVTLMLGGFILHLVALRLVPLFLAQAGIAVSLVVTALLAVLLFRDRLSATEWAAIAAAVLGLVLLSASAGKVGPDRAGHGLIVTLFCTVAVLAVLASLAARSVSPAGTAALGVLAGLGYAVVGISARVLPDLRPGDVLRAPSAYTLALAGGLAFFLYSLALQRGSVTLATTPMIVTQTLTPALVGVLVLGDGIRSGWVPAAMVGIVATLAGATALVRFEGAAAPSVEPVAGQPADGPG